MMTSVLLQYMVLYQLLLAVLNNMTFFMDGSSISNRQVRNTVKIYQMGKRASGQTRKRATPNTCTCHV